MSSIRELSSQWSGMRDIFLQLLDRLPSGDSIWSPSQYATEAWQHKLRKWNAEIDGLIEEYPLEASISEIEASHRELQGQASNMRLKRLRAIA